MYCIGGSDRVYPEVIEGEYCVGPKAHHSSFDDDQLM